MVTAPPSSGDLYQLALSAGKGEHNVSYIIATEGTYVCQITPSKAQEVLENLRQFLKPHMNSAESRHGGEGILLHLPSF